jgi:hypothetical protein
MSVGTHRDNQDNPETALQAARTDNQRALEMVSLAGRSSAGTRMDNRGNLEMVSLAGRSSTDNQGNPEMVKQAARSLEDTLAVKVARNRDTQGSLAVAAGAVFQMLLRVAWLWRLGRCSRCLGRRIGRWVRRWGIAGKRSAQGSTAVGAHSRLVVGDTISTGWTLHGILHSVSGPGRHYLAAPVHLSFLKLAGRLCTSCSRHQYTYWQYS